MVKRGVPEDKESAKKQKLSNNDKIEEPETADLEKSEKMIRIVTWNVAGLYAAVKKDFCGTVKKLNPDIMCIQETKTSLKKQPPSDIAEQLKEWKYRYYFDCSIKNGYSGNSKNACRHMLFNILTI